MKELIGIVLALAAAAWLLVTSGNTRIDRAASASQAANQIPTEYRWQAPPSSFGERNVSLYRDREDAKRAGAAVYTSGPCRGYYRGEEHWCQDRNKEGE